MEEDIGSAYPYFKKRKESELDRIGVDTEINPKSENYGLLEDIEDLKGEVMEEYRKFDFWEESNFYKEVGKFNGMVYSVEVVGENAEEYGEEVAKDYLRTMEDLLDYDSSSNTGFNGSKAEAGS